MSVGSKEASILGGVTNFICCNLKAN